MVYKLIVIDELEAAPMKGGIFTKSNVFISRWTVDPARRDEFIALFDSLWRGHIEAMEQITHFVYYGWGRDPNVMVAIESYKDESLLAELRKSGIFQVQVAKLLDCCSRPMTMELFSGLEGGRSVFDLYPAGESQVHPRGTAFGTVFL
jgi:quinol monooxygenase YgiN